MRPRRLKIKWWPPLRIEVAHKPHVILGERYSGVDLQLMRRRFYRCWRFLWLEIRVYERMMEDV